MVKRGRRDSSSKVVELEKFQKKEIRLKRSEDLARPKKKCRVAYVDDNAKSEKRVNEKKKRDAEDSCKSKFVRSQFRDQVDKFDSSIFTEDDIARINLKVVSEVRQLYELVNKLTEDQKMCVRVIGFGNLLDIGFSKLANDLYMPILMNYNGGGMMFLSRHGNMIFDKYHIHDVLGLPVSETDVVFIDEDYTKRKVGERKKWYRFLGIKDAKKPYLNLDAWNELFEKYNSGDDFKKLFVLFCLSRFLSPRGDYAPVVKCGRTLDDVTNIASYDWCGYVSNSLSNAIIDCHEFLTLSKNNGDLEGSELKVKLRGCMVVLVLCVIHHYKCRNLDYTRVNKPYIAQWQGEDGKLDKAVREFALNLEYVQPVYRDEKEKVHIDIQKTIDAQKKIDASLPVVDDIGEKSDKVVSSSRRQLVLDLPEYLKTDEEIDQLDSPAYVKKLLKIKRNTIAMCDLNLKIAEKIKQDAHHEFALSQKEGEDCEFNQEFITQIDAICSWYFHEKEKVQGLDTKLAPVVKKAQVVTEITTDKLDNIRPKYEATLSLSVPDKKPFYNLPCLVFPGPIRFVNFHSSMSIQELLPKQVLEDIRLEFLDKHNNHVKQGTKVELEVYGFCFLDQTGRTHKVDDDGFLDLSGLLKVTEGYGKPVSLMVKYDSKVVYTKKFRVQNRELRVTKVPESCCAGSKLKDIAFEVVDSEGNVDHTIHDEEKHGNSHTLKILTNLPDSDGLRYVFQQGRCTIPSITLPQREGTFSIEAIHSQYRDLRVKFEVNVSKSAPKDDTMSDTTSDVQASEDHDCDDIQSLDERLSHDSVSDAAEHMMSAEVLESQDKEDFVAQTSYKLSDSNYEHDVHSFKSPEGKITFLGSDLQDLEKAEKEIQSIGSCIKEKEDVLKWLVLRKNELTDDLKGLQAVIEVLPQPISRSDCRSEKEAVSANIESKVESAAAVYSIASQNNSLDQHPEFSADVIGVVALLTTAPSQMLSRSLAEYLGEDQMLGIVCQSSAAITTPEMYEYVLLTLARDLGRSIGGRQLIICLEDIRPYAGDYLEFGCQTLLALPKPTLPDRTTPPGFLGHAVNMIDIDPDYIKVKTVAGHGLRETLFYKLFGELQVYETKEHLKHAGGCITEGAVSLDGGIIQGKGIISLGSKDVDVCFPVKDADFSNWDQVVENYKGELSIVEEAIASLSEERESCLEAFRDREAGFRKCLEESRQKLLLSQQSMKLTPMTPARSCDH